MEGYGVRVQYSGFEVILDRLTHAAMVAEIGDAITEADSVRIYRVPSNADISVLGYGGRYESVEVIII
jgi:CRISPR-associated endonuclease Cas2